MNEAGSVPIDVVRLFGPPPVPVTVVIPALDEGARIGEAVTSAAWADEVIVVDGGSSDRTATTASDAGARVIVLPGVTIGGQRNAGIAAARNQWILALDSDERASPELRDEIRSLLAGPAAMASGYRIRFRTLFHGRELKHGEFQGAWHVRFFPRERRFNASHVHERLEPIEHVVSLRGTVIHHSFRDFAHFVTKVVPYARWGADDLAARGKRAGIGDITVRPAWRFFRDYVLYAGFLDGLPGFLVAAFASFGSLLRYSYRITEQGR